ncbi:MAG: hypothetical protein STSR0001_16680 [Methanothrix sp.]
MATLYPENIPEELKKGLQWAMWKKGTRNGKPAKIPCRVDGGEAKSNTPATWCQFSTALSAYQDTDAFDGICWMMPIEPGEIVFIDIDHCIKDGNIEPWAQAIVDRFNSYTERSQSGKGLHILIRGKKPIIRCRKCGAPYEIYDHLRPCYLTGDVI